MSIVLNRNEGLDVLHPAPMEQCNTDDADGRQTIDLATAKALRASGAATVCHHCDDGSLDAETETAP